jgi:hypothetical protein
VNARGRRRVALAAMVLGTTLAVPALAQAGSGPRWAVVAASGQLQHGSGVASVRPLPSSTGAYQVTFRGDVTQCAYIGTGAAGGPVQVTVASRAGNDNAVYVETRDAATGELANAPFQLVIHCPGKGVFAAVGQEGELDRGARVLSSARLAPGSYVVTFAKPVTACAVNATVGTTGIGVVAEPGVVSVASLTTDRRAVAVHVFSRSGAAVDQPFHLSVTCDGKPPVAVVGDGGRLVHGQHATSVRPLGDGRFAVTFDRPVGGCASSATAGGDVAAVAGIVVGDDDRVLLVSLWTPAGQPRNAPFQLTVFC